MIAVRLASLAVSAVAVAATWLMGTANTCTVEPAQLPPDITGIEFLPPCQVEDDPGPCWWDAPERGNGDGQSYVTMPDGNDGRVIYLATIPACASETGPGFCLYDGARIGESGAWSYLVTSDGRTIYLESE